MRSAKALSYAVLQYIDCENHSLWKGLQKMNRLADPSWIYPLLK